MGPVGTRERERGTGESSSIGVREALSEEVTFEQKSQPQEELNHAGISRGVLQAGGLADAKAQET